MFKTQILSLLILVMGVIAVPHHAQASMLSHCEMIYQARQEMPMLFVSTGSDCQQAVQNTVYSASAAVNGNNAAGTLATLGMVNVETGCVSSRYGAVGCDGTYGGKATCSTCSAFGAGQIIGKTWTGLNSGSDLAAIKSKLGGCNGGAPTGSLLDPTVTKDANALRQFTQYRNAVCTNPSYVASAAGQQQYGSMSAVSILTASQLDNRYKAVVAKNPAIISQMTTQGANANMVSLYVVHNLGAGGGPKFLNAYAADPNASVATVVSAKEMSLNAGLYCVGGKVPCTPVSMSTTVARMNDKMVSGECTKEGMNALKGQLVGDPGSTASIPSDGVVPEPGVNTQAGLDNAAALQEFLNSGGPSGNLQNDCSTGASRPCRQN